LQKSRVILITGTTSGIGKACADSLHAAGNKVYGTVRNVEKKPVVPYPILQHDVTDKESIRRCIGSVIAEQGRVDVLINNAAIALSGAAEELSDDDANEVMQTNFWGVCHLCQQVLPYMRTQNAGLIITLSSIAGLVSLPFQSLYCASKYALEGYCESLRLEVAPHNIAVVLLEPGSVKTQFFKKRRGVKPPSAPYRAHCRNVELIIARDEMAGISPAMVAGAVMRIVKARKPKLRYRVGRFTERLAPGLKYLLTQRLFELVISKYFQRALPEKK